MCESDRRTAPLPSLLVVPAREMLPLMNRLRTVQARYNVIRCAFPATCCQKANAIIEAQLQLRRVYAFEKEGCVARMTWHGDWNLTERIRFLRKKSNVSRKPLDSEEASKAINRQYRVVFRPSRAYTVPTDGEISQSQDQHEDCVPLSTSIAFRQFIQYRLLLCGPLLCTERCIFFLNPK